VRSDDDKKAIIEAMEDSGACLFCDPPPELKGRIKPYKSKHEKRADEIIGTQI